MILGTERWEFELILAMTFKHSVKRFWEIMVVCWRA
jgi:hypothetical protein